MQYITTTELRTKSKALIKALQEGLSIELVHRSKVVGEIKPAYETKPLTERDIKQIQKAARKLSLPKMSYKQREKVYREHLVEKYGKDLS